eukprot:jgi/Psemu1/26440/gm1.26440_g
MPSSARKHFGAKKLNVMEASVVEDIIIQLVHHTSSQFGLTQTENGPQGHSAFGTEFNHTTLNNQVVPNVLLPPIAREAIEFCIVTENKDDTADSIDGGVEYPDLEIDDVRLEIEPNKKSDNDPKFHPKKIVNWLPDNKPAQIYVIFTPLSPDNDPQMTENTFISELHGKWWSESWKLICQEGNPEPEILVPLIFYMDGISLDAHGRLTLTPLNMTLDIFNVETRKLPQAWTTIYFHPDKSMQNLHNAIQVALASLTEILEPDHGILWEYLLHAGKLWKVRMKFAIAYVIGDTELHDKLCGKYGSRNSNVKTLCRHGNCPTNHINRSAAQTSAKLWSPSDFQTLADVQPTEAVTYFKDISHHQIINEPHPEMNNHPQEHHDNYFHDNGNQLDAPLTQEYDNNDGFYHNDETDCYHQDAPDQHHANC